MRTLFTIIILVVAASLVDAYYFGGAYRRAAWNEAQIQGQQISSQINETISKFLSR